MTNKINRKQLSGTVQSNKMDKTGVVEIMRKIPHKMYNKYVNRSKKYYAHDPQNLCSVGDIVIIEESKPEFAITHEPGCMFVTDLKN